MSTQDEFGPPLAAFQNVMYTQMARVENVEKSSWLGPEKTMETLSDDFQRNLNKFALALNDGDVEKARIRAANVANFAWMLCERLESEQNAPDD